MVGGPLVLRAAGTGSDGRGRLRALGAGPVPAAAGSAAEVDRLILTASGGPFRGRTRDEMAAVTPAEALAHPTWAMGRVITTNSATLVNKGLELLEAHLLYGVALDRIDVVVHPQSIVHSMVQFVDGSTLAQCSPPDMRLPIALALSWPERLPGVARPATGARRRAGPSSRWTTRPFPRSSWPGRAGRLGGTAPAVYNAANEECVDAFHAGRIGFPTSATSSARCWPSTSCGSVSALEADRRGLT